MNAKLSYDFKIALLGCISLVFISLFTLSCKEDEEAEPHTFEVEGVIREIGITTYQYGTHSIQGEFVTFALRSNSVDLNQYIGDTVIIIGSKVEGYPLEGGPELIEVKSVK